MTLTIEATYKNGVLKPKKRLKIPDGARVRVTITPLAEEDPFADLIGICHSGRRDGAANHDKYLKRKRGR